jgi:restriction system protein
MYKNGSIYRYYKVQYTGLQSTFGVIILETINLPVINSERRYWLVRSNGGKYYNSFVLNDYIGIGWDKVDKIFIGNKSVILDRDIKNLYKPKNEEKKLNYSLIAKQINRFLFEIKHGDIIITPSENSKFVAFGRVIDEQVYFVEESEFEHSNILKKGDEYFCPYLKRRKVEWLNKIDKQELDPYLFKLFHSHHTISEADKYAPYIDRIIDSLFIKGDQGHLILQVKQKGKIQADLLADFINSTLGILDYDYLYSKNVNRKNIDIKLNVQSPGPIELIGPINDILLISSFIFSSFTGLAIKLSTSDKEVQNPTVERALEAVNKDQLKKYGENVKGQLKLLEEVSVTMGKLKIEDPSKNINSSKLKIKKKKRSKTVKKNIYIK